MNKAKSYLSTLFGVKVFGLNVQVEDAGHTVYDPQGRVTGVADGTLSVEGYAKVLAQTPEHVAGLLSRGGSIRVTQLSRSHDWNPKYPLVVSLNFQGLLGDETAELMRLMADDFRGEA